METPLLLVAELNDAGRVVAVWKRARHDRTARHMTSNDLDPGDLNQATYYGAPPQAIASFIHNLPNS